MSKEFYCSLINNQRYMPAIIAALICKYMYYLKRERNRTCICTEICLRVLSSMLMYLRNLEAHKTNGSLILILGCS